MDKFNNTTLKTENIGGYRQCGNCKKTYQFCEIKKSYPKILHEELKKIWKNPEIKFYCSYCYLLKLIGFLKKA